MNLYRGWMYKNLFNNNIRNKTLQSKKHERLDYFKLYATKQFFKWFSSIF